MSASDTPFTDLLDRALEAEHSGRLEQACGLLRQVAQAAEPSLRLDAALRLGKLCVSGGAARYVEAESILKDARRQAQVRNAPRQEAAAIHLLALLHYRRRQLHKARQLLETSPILQQTAAPAHFQRVMQQGAHFRYQPS